MNPREEELKDMVSLFASCVESSVKDDVVNIARVKEYSEEYTQKILDWAERWSDCE